MNKKIVDSDKVISLYKDGLSMIEIAKLCGCKSYGPIKRILINEGFNLKLRIGKKSRKHHIDESFFENIDTPEKAYVLGWVVSDGYINKYKLTFCVKDLEVVVKIRKFLKSEHKISPSEIFDKRTGKIYKRYFLQLTSKRLVDSLKILGISQSKSFTATFPDIPSHLNSHLIRGIFDGDGHIGQVLNKPRLSLIITDTMLPKIENITNSLGIILNKKYVVSEKDGFRVLKIYIYRPQYLKTLLDYIYKDCGEMKLNRKYQKYLTLIR